MDTVLLHYERVRAGTALGLWFDFDRRSHSDHKPHICGDAVNINVYGDALGQAHPGEDRANGGKSAFARDDVGHHDAAGYAVDMPV